MLAVTIVGAKEARAYLAKCADGAKALDGYAVQVGTPLVYGYGIHFGHHRGGRLARRAGGVPYLEQPLQQELPRIERDVADAIPKGGQATRQALLKGGYRIQARGQGMVPVVTGSLRRSIHTQEVGG